MLNVSCLSFGLKSSLETFIMRSLVYDSLIFFPSPHLETLYLGTIWVLYVLLMLLWLWCLYILPYIWNILAWSSSDSVTFWYSSFFFFDAIFSRELQWGPTANSESQGAEATEAKWEVHRNHRHQVSRTSQGNASQGNGNDKTCAHN